MLLQQPIRSLLYQVLTFAYMQCQYRYARILFFHLKYSYYLWIPLRNLWALHGLVKYFCMLLEDFVIKSTCYFQTSKHFFQIFATSTLSPTLFYGSVVHRSSKAFLSMWTQTYRSYLLVRAWNSIPYGQCLKLFHKHWETLANHLLCCRGRHLRWSWWESYPQVDHHSQFAMRS